MKYFQKIFKVINTTFAKVVLMTFLSFGINISYSQPINKQIDSLERVLKTSKTDSVKFNLSLILIDRYKNIDSAKTSVYLLKTEKFAKTEIQKVRFLIAKASFLIVYGKMNIANDILFKALKISKDKNYLKEEGKIYNNLGVSYLQLSDNSLALKYQLAALKIREKLNDDIGLESSNNNIGNIYFAILEDDKAFSYYKKALQYANKLNLDVELGKIYNNISCVFYDKKQYQQTKYYLLKSLSYKKKTNSITGQITTLNSLGDVCSSLESYKESEAYYQQAMYLANKAGDEMNKANILNSLGHLYRYKNEFSGAINYQNQALALSKKIDYLDIHKDALLELSINYRKLKKYEKAYNYFNEYITIKDSILKASSNSEIAELQTKYDTEKRIQKIALLGKENTIQKLDIKSRDLRISIMIYFFCFVMICGFFIYKSYHLKQQKNLQLAIINQQDLASKAILKAEENERKRIASDLHDGLGQMFSTVKLNLSNSEDEVSFKNDKAKDNFLKTINLVDNSCRELRTISHQMASDVLMNLGLVAAIRDFIQNIDQEKLKINFESVGINERIPANVESVLYRIIQESLNNVIKHANASNLDIQLVKEKNELTLVIEDNGIGFNTNEIEKFNGIGLNNIKSRVTYLKGTVDFDSALNRGTVISIFIQLA
jgi:two-component system NarL family sensor kinase